MSAGAMAAIIAARQAQERKRLEEHEEEKLTQYSSNDLDKYEFKIVRSQWGKFKNLETVQQLCADESKAGWEMVEKFDDNRIRFKRRIEMRSQDTHQQFDSYRTKLENSSGSKFLVVFGILLALLGVAVALFFATGGYIEFTSPTPIIILSVVILAVIMIAIKKKSS